MPRPHDAFIRIAALAALLAVSVSFSTVHVDAAESTRVQIPFSAVVSPPCAGEDVLIEGILYGFERTGTDAAGGVHSTGHVSYQGVQGTGLTTGEKYVATAGTRDTYNARGPAPIVLTTVFTASFVRSGDGILFRSHEVIHLTINADGSVSVNFEKMEVTCA